MLIIGMTAQEIRVLQEFRRVGAEALSLAAIKAIRHPAGGGEAPAFSLITKGLLVSDEGRQNFTLTEKAKEFLAIEAMPLYDEPSGPSEAVLSEE